MGETRQLAALYSDPLSLNVRHIRDRLSVRHIESTVDWR